MIQNRGVTRYSKAGRLFNGAELKTLVNPGLSNQDESSEVAVDFRTRAREVIEDLAQEAQQVGRAVCQTEGCRLSVAGLCLFDTVSVTDAEVRPQCDVSNCVDQGVNAADQVVLEAFETAARQATAYPDCWA